MTELEAMHSGQAVANISKIDILVYHDPIGGNEYEEEHWGYGPAHAADILALFREKEYDLVLSPE